MTTLYFVYSVPDLRMLCFFLYKRHRHQYPQKRHNCTSSHPQFPFTPTTFPVKTSDLNPARRHTPIIPAHLEAEGGRRIKSSRLAWATQQNFVSKKSKKKKSMAWTFQGLCWLSGTGHPGAPFFCLFSSVFESFFNLVVYTGQDTGTFCRGLQQKG